MAGNKKILIVDDDELIVNLLDLNLKMEGYQTLKAYDGEEALALIEVEPPDMVILDVMMPKLDGFGVCEALNGRGIPIIMLTAKSDITDKLFGLELGADDYMIKPFEAKELIARIRALFRRMDITKGTSLTSEVKMGLVVDTDGHRVLVDGVEVNLTPREFDLLVYLIAHPERVFSREQLLETVWGYEYLGDSRTVDMHIQRLRRKIGKFRKNIITVFGVGYKYQEMVK